jgi:hypothetical protein
VHPRLMRRYTANRRGDDPSSPSACLSGALTVFPCRPSRRRRSSHSRTHSLNHSRVLARLLECRIACWIACRVSIMDSNDPPKAAAAAVAGHGTPVRVSEAEGRGRAGVGRVAVQRGIRAVLPSVHASCAAIVKPPGSGACPSVLCKLLVSATTGFRLHCPPLATHRFRSTRTLASTTACVARR